MSFDIGLIINNTISGILVNLPWFLLFFIGFKLIAKEISIGIKNIPSWINQYFKLQREQLAIERALISGK